MQNALRWHAAWIFAVVPLLLMVIFQVVVLTNPDYNTLIKKVQPALFFMPLACIAAASGYGVARTCCRGTLVRAALIGIALGVLWSVTVQLVGNVAIVLPNNGRMDTPQQQLSNMLNMGQFLCPAGVVLSGIIRWYGRRSKFSAMLDPAKLPSKT